MIRYNSEWHDMSDYVVHFTKSSPGKTAYDNMISILANRVINASSPFGIARRSAPIPQNQFAVCLSEIPLHLLQRLAERRGGYGIGFTKQFLVSKGGGPIWYIHHESKLEQAILEIIETVKGKEDYQGNPLWNLTPFIDSSGDYVNGAYRFEWEREWRHVGNLNFSEHDPAFLIIPEELHLRARQFFEEAQRDGLGPPYLCPFIDIGWSKDQIRDTLEHH